MFAEIWLIVLILRLTDVMDPAVPDTLMSNINIIKNCHKKLNWVLSIMGVCFISSAKKRM